MKNTFLENTSILSKSGAYFFSELLKNPIGNPRIHQAGIMYKLPKCKIFFLLFRGTFLSETKRCCL